jgi:hypothetical protein
MLLSIVHDEDAHQFEVLGALCFLGAHAHDTGELTDAERYLRQALALIRTNPSGSSGLEEIRLAEILLARGGADDLTEANHLLERRAADPPILAAARFRLALTSTRVALARGEQELASEWARAALVFADARHSGLANHPTLMLAQVDRPTREWLRAVAEGGSARDLSDAEQLRR